MLRSLVLVPFVCSWSALSLAAQTGRTMKLMAPVVLGQTASMVMEHSPTLAGRQFAMAMCSPSYPGALPVSIPGVAEGVLRLDPLAYGVLGIGVLDASGVSPALAFLVPNSPLLVGASFDVQGADVDGTGLITLTDNDLEIEVAAPPPANLNMVAIAAGTFSMGSPVMPLGAAPFFNQANAQPVHGVTITRPFWMGKYEVTQTEYQAVMGSNPSYVQGSNLPVEQVSWFNAMAYCDALTVLEAAAGRLPSGYEYRLPTEAEWEYCCRAGTTTEFHYGSTLLCGQANLSYSHHSQSSCSSSGTVSVGGYLPNAWGLHDMHGNVWEWCLDSWNGSANYPAGTVADPYVTSGPIQVVRGGSWNFSSSYCRSAFRFWNFPDITSLIVGFRVVCAPVR